MGYRKWRLGHGDSYQDAVACYRTALLLDAHARCADGPLALACEQPVQGWDDIVEFGSSGQGLTATHFQVKRQNTSLRKSELESTFDPLFREAANLYKAPDPYSGLEVAPTNRQFRFVVPRDDISAGKLELDQLRKLLENCSDDSSATAIVGNDGARIDDGKGNGQQQRGWLQRIKAAIGDDAVCARVLARSGLEVWVEDGFLVHQAQTIVAQHFDDPQQAMLIIDEAVRNVSPEGYLDIALLMGRLEPAKPKLNLQQVQLAATDQSFIVRPFCGSIDLPGLTQSIVDRVWADHGATGLHIGYAPPGVEKTLRLACVRLLLHAGSSPVRLANRDAWRDRCKAEVAGTLGFAGTRKALDGGHFVEQVARYSLPPKSVWRGTDLGDALHSAMDSHLWQRVHEKAASELDSIHEVDCETTLAYLQALPDFYDRTLKGWWGAEVDVSGVARAGPRVAERIAQIVACVAVLEASSFVTGAANDDGAVGAMGELPVRALAIDQVSGAVDKVQMGVDITRFARQVVSLPGVLLLCANADDIYDLAEMRRMDEDSTGAGIMDWTPAAFIMDPRSVAQAVTSGLTEAEALIRKWCKRRADHYQASLEAAIEQHQESDAAK